MDLEALDARTEIYQPQEAGELIYVKPYLGLVCVCLALGKKKAAANLLKKVLESCQEYQKYDFSREVNVQNFCSRANVFRLKEYYRLLRKEVRQTNSGNKSENKPKDKISASLFNFIVLEFLKTDLLENKRSLSSFGY